jgi:hypothetical protein
MHVRWCPLPAPPPCRICTTPCPPGSPPWPQRITATQASSPTVVSRRGRFGERNPDRRGAAPLRASGHAHRRRARTHAAYVSRHGHPVVDGRVGAARRAVQRDPRPGPRAPAAVDAVGRLTRAENIEPQRIATVRRATRRETGRHSRRRCAILRLAGQLIHIGRSEAPTAARHVRPVGNRSRCGRPRRSGTVGSNEVPGPVPFALDLRSRSLSALSLSCGGVSERNRSGVAVAWRPPQAAMGVPRFPLGCRYRVVTSDWSPPVE